MLSGGRGRGRRVATMCFSYAYAFAISCIDVLEETLALHHLLSA